MDDNSIATGFTWLGDKTATIGNVGIFILLAKKKMNEIKVCSQSKFVLSLLVMMGCNVWYSEFSPILECCWRWAEIIPGVTKVTLEC